MVDTSFTPEGLHQALTSVSLIANLTRFTPSMRSNAIGPLTVWIDSHRGRATDREYFVIRNRTQH